MDTRESIPHDSLDYKALEDEDRRVGRLMVIVMSGIFLLGLVLYSIIAWVVSRNP